MYSSKTTSVYSVSVPYLERSPKVELLSIAADERPGRVQLNEVETVAALVNHLLPSTFNKSWLSMLITGLD